MDGPLWRLDRTGNGRYLPASGAATRVTTRPYAPDMAPRLLRLLVPSPDGRRLLARPNGLAGWALPAVPAGPEGWSDEVAASAGRVVGAPVRPVREVVDGAGEVEALDRIPAAGVTWIGLDEAGRLGADAGAVRRWAELGGGRGPQG